MGMIRDIMLDCRQDAASWPLRAALRLLAVLYGVLVWARNFLYDREILKSRQVPCRVICIGNLTAGGSGKTPLVVMTARMLGEHGVKVAVVSRGYRRETKGALVVSDGVRIATPAESGDEPHLIAASLPGVPVVVGENRYEAAMLACARFKPETIVLDDGFQHRGLWRDIDLLAMDAANPVGSDYLLPRGLLREPAKNMKRAKAVVFTRVSAENPREPAERAVRYYSRAVPLFWTQVEPDGLREPGGTGSEPVAALAGKKVAALSNMANPASFYAILEQAGADIVLKQPMPDHHRYAVAEIGTVLERARAAGAECLVMTAKDERNLPADTPSAIMPVRVLDIRAVLIDQEQDFLSLILPYGKRTQ